MIVYKAVNKINGKIYVGQTQHSLEQRKREHFKKAREGYKTHFYHAIRKYGEDAFEFSVICTAKTKADLNLLETYYIQKYNSIQNGYNMVDGGDNNIMSVDAVYQKHKAKMQSEETRAKLSKTMKEKIARGEFFTPEHRKHLSDAQRGRKFSDERRAKCDTRSVGCYCVLDSGEHLYFHSYLDAGKWWYDKYKPFPYSECTYQRKIKESINLGYCTYGRGSKKKIISDVVWFKGGDADEKVTNT